MILMKEVIIKVYNRKASKLSNLRYAPAVGAGLGVFSDLMGWTNKPDYSSADMIANSTKNLSNIKFNPIGDQMKYQPMDRNYYLNQLHGNAGSFKKINRESKEAIELSQWLVYLLLIIIQQATQASQLENLRNTI